MEIDVTRIRGLMESKLSSAQSLQLEWQGKNEVMPQEMQDRVNALLGEFDGYKAQLDIANRTAAQDAFMNDPVGRKSTAQPATWREAGPGEGFMFHFRTPML